MGVTPTTDREQAFFRAYFFSAGASRRMEEKISALPAMFFGPFFFYTPYLGEGVHMRGYTSWGGAWYLGYCSLL